mmetsp:Transcript_39436/g.82463  ORF Transcript_39436/g.82463 Transcript_39436/m.82463 type:complete len:246 (+) Transcript_39436:405-1142(+)
MAGISFVIERSDEASRTSVVRTISVLRPRMSQNSLTFEDFKLRSAGNYLVSPFPFIFIHNWKTEHNRNRRSLILREFPCHSDVKRPLSSISRHVQWSKPDIVQGETAFIRHGRIMLQYASVLFNALANRLPGSDQIPVVRFPHEFLIRSELRVNQILQLVLVGGQERHSRQQYSTARLLVRRLSTLRRADVENDPVGPRCPGINSYVECLVETARRRRARHGRRRFTDAVFLDGRYSRNGIEERR